ncbi:MAG: hypothetical protein IJR96_08600, partial [Pseudobutyrivibrio sp.]|nr:hypothetical protein [Pseudobutyrivibrio sp.]
CVKGFVYLWICNLVNCASCLMSIPCNAFIYSACCDECSFFSSICCKVTGYTNPVKSDGYPSISA